MLTTFGISGIVTCLHKCPPNLSTWRENGLLRDQNDSGKPRNSSLYTKKRKFFRQPKPPQFSLWQKNLRRFHNTVHYTCCTLPQSKYTRLQNQAMIHDKSKLIPALEKLPSRSIRLSEKTCAFQHHYSNSPWNSLEFQWTGYWRFINSQFNKHGAWKESLFSGRLIQDFPTYTWVQITKYNYKI